MEHATSFIDEPDDRRPKVFILEDNPLISLDLARTAEELGYDVVGPVHALSPTVSEIASGGEVDVAIIDLVLANGSSDRIIRQFQDRGVPVIICSGLMKNAVKGEFPEAEVLGKPHRDQDLRSALSRVLVLRVLEPIGAMA